MFTRNMHSFMYMCTTGYSGSSATGSAMFYDCVGTSFSGQMYYTRDGFLGWMTASRCKRLPTTYSSSASGAGGGVYFGTGSTPATWNDYTLESPITSGLTTSSGGRLTERSGDTYSYLVTYTLYNNTDADINIYEVGLFSPVSYRDDQHYLALMERTVLTEPITIPAGESKLVTYKITFNQTLNVENTTE